MENIRVQVNLSASMVSKIDYLAKYIGVSRSALCAFIIGQYIFNLEMVRDKKCMRLN